MAMAAARVLFPSSVSTSAPGPSAFATMKYAPAVVAGGIVSVVVPTLLAPGSSCGIARSPMLGSLATRTELLAR